MKYHEGKFKVLQFADMHYNNGGITRCSDVPTGMPCSDLNTTEFLRRLLLDERPDFVVFTGDNIDGGAINAQPSEPSSPVAVSVFRISTRSPFANLTW